MSAAARQQTDSPDDPCPETDYPAEIIETPGECASRRLSPWYKSFLLLSAPTPTPHRVTEAAPRANTSRPDLQGAGRTVYDSWVRPPSSAPPGTCVSAGR